MVPYKHTQTIRKDALHRPENACRTYGSHAVGRAKSVRNREKGERGAGRGMKNATFVQPPAGGVPDAVPEGRGRTVFADN